MSYKIISQDHKVCFRFVVSAEDFTHELERELFRNKDKMNLSVYRDGKVPAEVLEKMYDKNEILTKVMNTVIAKEYGEALEENEFEVVSAPVLKVEHLAKGEAFIFTAEAYLKPEVVLGTYKGIEAPKPDYVVTDEEINGYVQNFLNKHATQEDVTDRPVENGDLVHIDFEGFLFGRPFKGNKAENFPLTIGSKSFVGDFEEKLIGTSLNEARDITVTYPDNYRVEELAGNDVIFRCIVRKITKKTTPEFNDAFVKEHSKFETVKDYMDTLRTNMENRKRLVERRKFEDTIVQAIVNDAKMEIPDEMIESEQNRLVREQLANLNKQGLTQEQYFKMSNLTMEKFTEQMLPLAKKRVTGRLVLEAVADAENLAATPDEIETEIVRIAKSSNMETEEFRKSISRSGSRRLKRDIAIQKAARFVVENAVAK